jgi:ketosteroid isomerase-like protein
MNDNTIMTKRRALALLAAPAIFATPGRAETKAAPSPGEKLLSEFWAKVWNAPQDLDTIDRLCTEDFVITSAGKDIVGRKAFKEWVGNFGAKIGEMRLTNLDMFSSADGSRVVSRWIMRGVNLGMFGTAADRQPVEFTGIAVWELRDGKLAHNWVERSALELKERLTKKQG